MRFCNHSNRRGCGVYLAALVAGILVAMLLPVWMCFCIIIAILVLLCFL